MSSYCTINFNETTSVKHDADDIVRIMYKGQKIWPKFPFVLLQNDEYYTVTDIQNNQYVKTLIPTQVTIDCPLVNCKACYNTGIYRKNKLQFELAFTSLNSNGRTFFGNLKNDTMYSSRFFTASSTTWYLDYMRLGATSSSVLRVSNGISNSDLYNLQRVKKFLYRAGHNSNTGKNFIHIKNYGSDTNDIMDFNPSQIAYDVPETTEATDIYLLGCWNTTDHLLMYYGKLYDENDDLIGFWHFKNNNGQYKMYDEISGNYLQTQSGKPGESNNVVYSDNILLITEHIYDGDPPYIIDGTITESGKQYEKLVNIKNGDVLKGIEIL